VVSKNQQMNVTSRELFLDPPGALAFTLQQGALQLIPSCARGDLVRVCRLFFRWSLNISNNKLDQPTIAGDIFSVEMTGPRVHSWYDLGSQHYIEAWLVNYSSGHLHDPANENRIMLYVASRVAVYEAYAEDFVSGRSQLSILQSPIHYHLSRQMMDGF